MQDILNKRSFSIMPWVVVWVIYTLCYTLAKFYDTTHWFSAGLPLASSIIVDLLMIGYAFWLWQHSAAIAKLTFGLLLLSFLCLIGLDVVYHTLYDVLQIPRLQVSAFWVSIYNLLYLGYLLLQMGVWASILSIFKSHERRFVFLCIPVTVIMLVVFFVYIFTVQWNPSKFTLIGFYDGLGEIFELFGFVAAALCLVTARNWGIKYIALGYAIIIAAGFIADFKLFSQAYGSGSIIETLWVLGPIVVINGLFIIKNSELYLHSDTWVELPANVRSQVAYWAFLGAVFAFVILTVVVYCSSYQFPNA